MVVLIKWLVFLETEPPILVFVVDSGKWHVDLKNRFRFLLLRHASLQTLHLYRLIHSLLLEGVNFLHEN